HGEQTDNLAAADGHAIAGSLALHRFKNTRQRDQAVIAYINRHLGGAGFFDQNSQGLDAGVATAAAPDGPGYSAGHLNIAAVEVYIKGNQRGARAHGGSPRGGMQP